MFPIYKTKKELEDLDKGNIKYFIHGEVNQPDGIIKYNISYSGILT